MLHSLPALLDDLEQRLMQGEDPLPLLGAVKWHDIVDWPKNTEEAMVIKRRLACINTLITGLNAPIQATIASLGGGLSYGAAGRLSTPPSLTRHFSQQI